MNKKSYYFHFRVDDDEKELIYENMKLLGYNNLSCYLRRATKHPMIININLSELQESINKLSEAYINNKKIGINLNQIAKKINTHIKQKNEITDETLFVLTNEIKEINDDYKRNYETIKTTYLEAERELNLLEEKARKIARSF